MIVNFNSSNQKMDKISLATTNVKQMLGSYPSTCKIFGK